MTTRDLTSNYRSATMPMPIVFYDGGCPLCRREIAHYQKLQGADSLEWLDITKNRDRLVGYGLTDDEAMARFHVLDAAGRWQTGVWGFIELWSHLPAYRWLAHLLRRSRLLPLLDRAYARFARWRWRRRGCNADICGRPVR